MSTPKSFRYLSAVPFAAAIAFAGLPSASAETLSFQAQPVSNVIAKLHNQYGINIVLKGDIPAAKPVTFDVGDMGAPGSAQEAISDLANSLGADFTKTFVVSKIPAGDPVPGIRIDSDSTVVFPHRRMPTEDAIQSVAGVDNAVAKISGEIDSQVVLSSTTLTAAKAASEIADQTHTQWKAFYAIVPRGDGPSVSGRVVGYTSSGRPIIEEPYVYYRRATGASKPVSGDENIDDSDVRDQPSAADEPPAAAADQAAVPPPAGTVSGGATVPINPNQPMPNSTTNTGTNYYPGAAPYGYNPYGGYNSYGGGYGYNPYGGGYGGYDPNGGGYGYNPYGGGGYGNNAYGGGYGYNPYGGGYGYNPYGGAPPAVNTPIINGQPTGPVSGGVVVNGQPLGATSTPYPNAYGWGMGY